MKRYGLKGINDEATECSVCGKVELRRVMWLVELDPVDGNELGDAFPVGTTCGAKMLGYSTAKVRKAADNFVNNVSQRRYQIAQERIQQNGGNEIIAHLNEMHLGPGERFNNPLMDEYRKIKVAANAWASTQPIVIAL